MLAAFAAAEQADQLVKLYSVESSIMLTLGLLTESSPAATPMRCLIGVSLTAEGGAMKSRSLALLYFSAFSYAQEPLLSVCDVLKSQAGQGDRFVSVRGEWITGLENNYLYDPKCDWSAGDATGLAAIDLTQPNLLGTPRVRFELDVSSFSKFSEELGKLLRGRLKSEVRVYATFYGWLLVKDRRQKYRDPSGEIRLRGFGHLGSFPVQLICMRVGNPEVQPKGPGLPQRKDQPK